jgi:FKBP12-rapamycin complex-associated protein
LVGVIRHRVRGSIKDVVGLIHDLWDTTTQRVSLVVLLGALSSVLAAEFHPYITRFVQKLLVILHNEKTDALAILQAAALSALISFGSNLPEYLNLVVPALISCYRFPRTPLKLRLQAIKSAGVLSKSVDLYPYASRLIHSLTALLVEEDHDLCQAVVKTLLTLTYTLGRDILIFIPSITKVSALGHSSSFY